MTDDRFFVKTLTLENFRCFEKVELGPFDPHFNLLVGTNGSGKSSVLLALANLFRPLALPDWNAASDGRLLGPSDVRIENRIESDGVRLQKRHMPGGVRASFTLDDGNWIAAENFSSRNTISPNGIWGPERSRHSRSSQDYLGSRIGSTYPILVFYKVSRLFPANSAVGTENDSSFPGERGLAFEHWSRAGTASDGLREWIKDQTLTALQYDYRERNTPLRPSEPGPLRQLGLIQKALAGAVEDAKAVEFDAEQKDIVVEFEGGERKDFARMSDGQRALIGLVADIARRACLLNAPYLGQRTLLDTPGLVLIDELDLHLHPRWQRRVVGDLKRIFPSIQFFATTHSPQIIGEARPEEIVMLTATGQKRPMGSYGMDSNWVLECVMEVEERDPEIARRIKTLFDAIEDDHIEEARDMIAALRTDMGDAPVLAGAESYIWRIEHEGDEAAE